MKSLTCSLLVFCFKYHTVVFFSFSFKPVKTVLLWVAAPSELAVGDRCLRNLVLNLSKIKLTRNAACYTVKRQEVVLTPVNTGEEREEGEEEGPRWN